MDALIRSVESATRAEPDMDLFTAASEALPPAAVPSETAQQPVALPAESRVPSEIKPEEADLPAAAVFHQEVESATKLETVEHGNGEHTPVSTVPSQPVSDELLEEESQEPSGFFSRLLRRATNY